MSDVDEEALKAEIEEIMTRVDTIMENVARVMPPDERPADDPLRG
jgi:hypothetical protein